IHRYPPPREDPREDCRRICRGGQPRRVSGPGPVAHPLHLSSLRAPERELTMAGETRANAHTRSKCSEVRNLPQCRGAWSRSRRSRRPRREGRGRRRSGQPCEGSESESWAPSAAPEGSAGRVSTYIAPERVVVYAPDSLAVFTVVTSTSRSPVCTPWVNASTSFQPPVTMIVTGTSRKLSPVIRGSVSGFGALTASVSSPDGRTYG